MERPSWSDGPVKPARELRRTRAAPDQLSHSKEAALAVGQVAVHGPRVARVQRGTETVEETARRYGIGRGMAYELARRGELPGVIRLGHRLLVARAVTDRMLGQSGPE